MWLVIGERLLFEAILQKEPAARKAGQANSRSEGQNSPENLATHLEERSLSKLPNANGQIAQSSQISRPARSSKIGAVQFSVKNHRFFFKDHCCFKALFHLLILKFPNGRRFCSLPNC